MRWGDYIEDTGEGLADLLGDAELIHQQMLDSIPELEHFDMTKPFTMGWYITQGE